MKGLHESLRQKYDKFICFRDFFKKGNENNAKDRYPSSYLAIDETLNPYWEHINFKQYNLSKPAKLECFIALFVTYQSNIHVLHYYMLVILKSK